MKTIAPFLNLVCFLFISLTSYGQHGQDQSNITANKNWESANILTTSESVCYNPDNKELYVSCINGSPLDKDGNGFISKLSLMGDVVVHKWITGLNAPKGMGISNGYLYVTDINKVVKISIVEEKIIQEFKVEGAEFLNDITVDPQGNVYISDMSTFEIHRIHDNKIELFLKHDKLVKPNGLAFENGNLLIGTQNGIFSLRLKSQKLNHLVKNTGSIDGLEPDGKGNYIISDWQGKVQVVNPDKEAILLFDTSDSGINAADIVYLYDRQLLLVPTFFDNRVTAYYLDYK